MKRKKNVFDKVVGAMLVAVAGIMPLVVQAAVRPLPEELIPYFSEEFYPGGKYLNMFSHWKGWFVYIPAIVIAFFYISDIITDGKLPSYKAFIKNPPVIFSAVYLIFVIISAAASKYPHTSWFGTFDRNEGVFMWLAYFVLFFSAIYFTKKQGNAKYILYGLAFSSVIMGMIGVSQFLEHDFFGTETARRLITFTDAKLSEQREVIDPNFKIAYGTQFNPNTFGQYAATLSPILLLAALMSDEKKYVKIIFLFSGILMLLGVFGSSSLGGLVSIVTAAGVLLVAVLCRPGVLSKKTVIPAAAVISLTLLAVFFVPQLNARVTHLLNRMGDAMRSETHSIENYIFDENKMIVLNEAGEIFNLTVNGQSGDWLMVRGADGNEIPADIIVPPHQPQPSAEVSIRESLQNMSPTEYIYDIPGYGTVRVEKYPFSFYVYTRSAVPFYLYYEDGEIYSISSSYEPVEIPKDIPTWGFYGRENWGSNRGYIWSRSFPLMPARAIIGGGPDTFINVFPKNDIVFMQRLFNNPFQIVDKAHNIFIQTWINTGGISAIALFALFLYYLVTTFFSLIKSKKEPLSSYGLRLGLLCGISAYCMAGMVTDTTIGSTGVFFVLLGTGYGLNYQHKASYQEPKRAAEKHN